MANAVDGVGTISVSTIVSQLMSVEGHQRTLLQNQQSSAQTQLSVLQNLNSQMSSLQTAAESIITSVLVPRPWSVNTLTSSSTSVTGTAGANATRGTYTVDVQSVAAAHSVLFDSSVSGTANVGGGSLAITQGGATTTVDLSKATTLADVAGAINGTSGLGLRASVLKVGTDSYRLQLTASTAGAASQFTVDTSASQLGTSSVAATGADTLIKYGPAATDVARSSTSTVTDLFPGVSFTVTKPETGVTLTVGQDTSTMTSQVKALVDAANAAAATIRSNSTYDAASKTAGPLLGNTLTQSLFDSLSNSIFSTTGTPASTLGISVDKTGALTFDAAAFTTAIAKDPAGAMSGVQAFATRLGQLAHGATLFGTGSLSQAITDEQSRISMLGTEIQTESDRLTAKQNQLTQQYSTLNTTLTTMNNQASWLSSQFSSLAAGTTTK